MRSANILVAGIAVLALVGVAPIAQSGSMRNGAAQRNGTAGALQSPAEQDLALAKQCQEKPQSLSATVCKNALARHPEIAGTQPKSALPLNKPGVR
jgi:hypothetical protein